MNGVFKKGLIKLYRKQTFYAFKTPPEIANFKPFHYHAISAVYHIGYFIAWKGKIHVSRNSPDFGGEKN